MRARTINLSPIYTEELTSREYLDVYSEEADNIESVRIKPPKLGSKGFGTIVITRKKPTYVTELRKHLKRNHRRQK